MAIIKHPEQRVGIFIDTQNLYHSAKNIYRARVNFAAVLADAIAGRRLVRALAYAVTTESGEEKGFFEALQKLGVEMRLKELQVFQDGAKKADWDVGLAVDVISASPKLDAVVLLTGDGDFVPLVHYLQNATGCQVEVVSFGRSTSQKLREAVDDFFDLDSDPRRYILGSRASRGRAGRRDEGARDAASSFDQGEASISAPEDSLA